MSNEQLDSPYLAERIAARLDLIDEHLDESARLGAMVDMLHSQVAVAGRWRHWLARRSLLREAEELIAERVARLDEVDRLNVANSNDLARSGRYR